MGEDEEQLERWAWEQRWGTSRDHTTEQKVRGAEGMEDGAHDTEGWASGWETARGGRVESSRKAGGRALGCGSLHEAIYSSPVILGSFAVSATLPRPPPPPPRPGIPCPHPPPGPNPALVTQEGGRRRCDSPIPTSPPAQSWGRPDMGERRDRVLPGERLSEGEIQRGTPRGKQQKQISDLLQPQSQGQCPLDFSEGFLPHTSVHDSPPSSVNLYTRSASPFCQALRCPSLTHQYLPAPLQLLPLPYTLLLHHTAPSPTSPMPLPWVP